MKKLPWICPSLFTLFLIMGASLRAEVLGEMTAMGAVVVITSEACKTADGKLAPGWLLSYSYDSIGNATRSCYQKYNDSIWLWEFSGKEFIYPASYFKPKAAAAKG